MFEFSATDQGSGLRQLAQRADPTVMGVLHHGDRLAELTLLWQLCSALQNQGYSVVVLDGTAEESESNAGLLTMLEQPYAPPPVSQADSQTDRWCVIPSALGFAHLTSRPNGLPMHQRLIKLSCDAAVMVVYADAAILGALKDAPQPCRPIVALSPETTSLLSAYQSVKTLAQFQAKGKPLAEVVAVSVCPPGTPEYVASAVANSLQNCTMNFLRCPLRHITTPLKTQASMAFEPPPREHPAIGPPTAGAACLCYAAHLSNDAFAALAANFAAYDPQHLGPSDARSPQSRP